jgi:hypothetical protein
MWEAITKDVTGKRKCDDDATETETEMETGTETELMR